MTHSLQTLRTLPAADLDRLAAEALGWSWIDSPKYGTCLTDKDGSPICRAWHPTTDENQCRLLLDEVGNRGLAGEFERAIIELLKPQVGRLLFHYIHAPAHAKTLAAVAAILNQGDVK